MNTPEWLKPGIYGAAIGAICISVAGFTWGGWVTSGTANDMAEAMSHDNVIAAMVPVCLDLARSDPARAANLELIRAATTNQRSNALMEAGWATMPGNDEPDREIARACLAELDVDATPERVVPVVEEG